MGGTPAGGIAVLLLWGLAYGGVSVGLMSWMMKAVPQAVEVATALYVGVFNIGIALGKRAAADGYTVGYGNINTLAVNRSLFKRLPYDVDQDLTPVAHMFDLYNALIVPADSPVKSVQDLIDLARKQPGRLSYGASGVGTTGHMGGELFKSMAKLDVMFIPYNGGPAAIQDLLGGRLDYLFVNTSEATPLVKSGKVRAIGVSSLKRLSLMPDVPTLDESGLKGYETWPR
ncbi:hypothetical protein G6F31_016796 [Rhizopus arrhizus]|nr:hypothetical protein G6F31_016796 [Rhizopus arrhizus]